jgi:putative FmdB family regulatory protein
MPIYEYQCTDCKEKFEKFVRGPSTDSDVECPRCKGHKVKKVFSMFSSGGSSSKGQACASSSSPFT